MQMRKPCDGQTRKLTGVNAKNETASTLSPKQSQSGSSMNLEELGIKQVTVGTVEELQMAGGELSVRLVHEQQFRSEEANPEVEAIKKDLMDPQQLGSNSRPTTTDVTGNSPTSPMVPRTPCSTTSQRQQSIEDVEEVINQEARKSAGAYQPNNMVQTKTDNYASTQLYVSVNQTNNGDERMMNYRTPAEMSSPHEQHYLPQASASFPVENSNAAPRTEPPHWSEVNAQPPGSSSYTYGGENSMAAELMEEITAQGIAERQIASSVSGDFGDDSDKFRGIRNMAMAYINHLAGDKVCLHCRIFKLRTSLIKSRK